MSNNYKTEYSAEKNINTLDRGSYNDFGDGTPAKQVLINELNKFAPSKDTDAITVEYPDDTTEIYRYRQGGIAGTILKSVAVSYSDNTKCELVSAAVT